VAQDAYTVIQFSAKSKAKQIAHLKNGQEIDCMNVIPVKIHHSNCPGWVGCWDVLFGLLLLFFSLIQFVTAPMEFPNKTKQKKNMLEYLPY
jgi:hypothetical protein